MARPPTEQTRDVASEGANRVPREGTPMVAAYSGLSKLRQSLDPQFAEVGLAPQPEAAGTVAAYAGIVDGRQVRVSCAVRTIHRYATSDISYRQFSGLTLEITVDSQLKTRMTISPRVKVSLAGADNVVVRAVIWAARLWAGRTGLAPVDVSPGIGGAVVVRAADAGWAREVVDSQFCQVLLDLLPPRNLGTLGPVGRWSLGFAPGEMKLWLTPEATTLTPPNLDHWLRTAVWLVQQGERFEHAHLAEPTPSGTAQVPAPDARRRVVLIALAVLGLVCLIPAVLVAFFGLGYFFFGERIMILPIVFMAFFMPYAMYLLVRNQLRSIAHSRRLANDPHWSHRSSSS